MDCGGRGVEVGLTRVWPGLSGASSRFQSAALTWPGLDGSAAGRRRTADRPGCAYRIQIQTWIRIRIRIRGPSVPLSLARGRWAQRRRRQRLRIRLRQRMPLQSPGTSRPSSPRGSFPWRTCQRGGETYGCEGVWGAPVRGYRRCSPVRVWTPIGSSVDWTDGRPTLVLHTYLSFPSKR